MSLAIFKLVSSSRVNNKNVPMTLKQEDDMSKNCPLTVMKYSPWGPLMLFRVLYSLRIFYLFLHRFYVAQIFLKLTRQLKNTINFQSSWLQLQLMNIIVPHHVMFYAVLNIKPRASCMLGQHASNIDISQVLQLFLKIIQCQKINYEAI